MSFCREIFVGANFVVFYFLSLSLFDVRSRWRCNESWHYVIHLLDRLCNDCLKLKHLFLLSLHLVDNLVKNVDELWSEHHVRTHINEPPCYCLYLKKVLWSLPYCFFSFPILQQVVWLQKNYCWRFLKVQEELFLMSKLKNECAWDIWIYKS